jgi:DNA-binding transcriptional ArsR family regulator
MYTIEDNYSRLESLLTEEKIYLIPDLTFEKVCSWLGVQPRELENLIFKELGLTGQGLIDRYRKDGPKYFRKKYNIKL